MESGLNLQKSSPGYPRGLSCCSCALQKDISALEHWEKTWQMSFNPIKCVVLRISLKKKVLPTQYELHGHTLEVVDSSKYLDVTIKDELSWGTRIQNTVSKANII